MTTANPDNRIDLILGLLFGIKGDTTHTEVFASFFYLIGIFFLLRYLWRSQND